MSRNIYEMSDTDNTTDDIPDENINSQLNETIYQLRLFGQESSNINISVVEVDHVTVGSRWFACDPNLPTASCAKCQ